MFHSDNRGIEVLHVLLKLSFSFVVLNAGVTNNHDKYLIYNMILAENVSAL